MREQFKLVCKGFVKCRNWSQLVAIGRNWSQPWGVDKADLYYLTLALRNLKVNQDCLEARNKTRGFTEIFTAGSTDRSVDDSGN